MSSRWMAAVSGLSSRLLMDFQQMKSVRTQTTANQYVGNGGLNLTLSRDIYRYTSQKRRQIPRNDNNNNSTGGGHGGAGFSGSISHTSSSGHGRSGKF